ncbi:MAG: isochorismatase family cysteine hydrolase [Candidatus Nanoarchaeia archaeon]|jgi:nicotinamidase-related amidase
MKNIEKILVIVDMQNDFVENRKINGADYKSALPVQGSGEIIYNNKLLIETYSKKSNAAVVMTRDTHTLTDSSSIEEFNTYGNHCVKNTFGWQFIDEFSYKTFNIPRTKVVSPEKIMELTDFAAFEKNTTNIKVNSSAMKYFEYMLNQNPNTEVYIAGLVAGICVKDTFETLKGLGYKNLCIVSDATKGLTIEGKDLTNQDLEALQNNGAKLVSTLEALI